MKRKECDNSKFRRRTVSVVVVLCAVAPAVARADGVHTVRVWPTAVVLDDHVRLGDLCELAGFDNATHERLRELVIEQAPPPGGSTAVTQRNIRTAIVGAGVNMARTIIKGATECAVRKPRLLADPDPAPTGSELTADGPLVASSPTLRETIIDHFEGELARYGGRVEIDFGHRHAAMLELGGQEFEFRVQRRPQRQTGLVDIQVELHRAGEVIQRVRMQPIVTLKRTVLVARRAINQKAPIGPEDVELREMTFDRLDQLGMTQPARAMGQRARRLIPAGTLIQLEDIESVPLINRGELVDVVSRAGGITVVTVARAMESGRLGDAIELRSGTKRTGANMTGLVTGPGRVELREAVAPFPGQGDRMLAEGGRR